MSIKRVIFLGAEQQDPDKVCVVTKHENGLVSIEGHDYTENELNDMVRDGTVKLIKDSL